MKEIHSCREKGRARLDIEGLGLLLGVEFVDLFEESNVLAIRRRLYKYRVILQT